MVSRQDLRDFVRIVFVCICWYIVSSSNGVIGKTILSQFPYPVTLTMVQLGSIALWSPPMLKILSVRPYEASGWAYYRKMLLPLAFGKFLSSVFAHISIWKVPVSYAHTVKASMPIFTVLISRVLLGEKHSWSIYVSLLPIVFGVATATLTEISFDVTGLTSALIATAGFALMNIFSKQALKDTGMHHLRLLHKLGQLAALMFFPFWLLIDGPRLGGELSMELVLLLLLDGALHWLQNIMAFTLLKLVAPLTYAVANVTKRISVISVSLLLLKNPVTATNLGGMVMAIVGVFCYNRAKYRENQRQQSLLPLTAPKLSSASARTAQQPLWQNHFTLDNQKVQVTTPLSYLSDSMDRNIKRNQ